MLINIMIYFSIIGKTESDDLAVFVNHATERKEGKSILNVVTKVMVINGRPNIVLVASRAIKKGAELAYYYGEKRRSVLNESQWMKWISLEMYVHGLRKVDFLRDGKFRIREVFDFCF